MPRVAEVGARRKSYRNRKGFFGIVAQAFCDSSMRFLYVSACHAGSTHDAVAFNGGALAEALRGGLLPEPYYVIGDEAYAASAQFLTPWSGRGLSPAKDAFNYHLSLMRQVIERAFGLLIRRWGIMWRALECAAWKWPLIVQVCCRLHNLCLGERLPDLNQEEFAHLAPVAADMFDEMRDSESTGLRGRRTDRAKCPKRDAITTWFDERGIVRPPHSEESARSRICRILDVAV